jgi:MFS family permease
MSLAPDIRAQVQRNLPLLTWFTFILGLRLYLPVFLSYYQQMGFNTGRTTLLWSASSIAIIASDGLTGLVADRWGYRRSLMLGACLLAAAFLGVYSAPDVPIRFWWVVTCQILIGLGFAFTYSATPQAFGSKSAEWLGRNGMYARFAGRSIASMFLASAMAAGLALTAIEVWPQSGPRLIWLIQALLAGGLFIVAYCTVDLEDFRVGKRQRRTVSQSLSELRAHWSIFLPLVPLVVLGVVNENAAVAAQAYCLAQGLGLIWSTVIVGSGFLLTAAASTKIPSWLDRFGLPRIVILAAVLAALSYSSVTILPGRWEAIGVVAMFGSVCLPFLAAATYLDRHVALYRATALSAITTAKNACTVFLLPLYGWLVDAYSFTLACLIWAVGFSAIFAVTATAIFRQTAVVSSTIPTESPPS